MLTVEQLTLLASGRLATSSFAPAALQYVEMTHARPTETTCAEEGMIMMLTGQQILRRSSMIFALLVLAGLIASPPGFAQTQSKPNILFIMGDDIGWMQPSIYHRGLMVGETPKAAPRAALPSSPGCIPCAQA